MIIIIINDDNNNNNNKQAMISSSNQHRELSLFRQSRTLTDRPDPMALDR